MDLQELYRWTYPTTVAVSPDGVRVAMVVTSFDSDEETTRQAVYVVPTDGSRPPRRLTRTSEAWAPKWSPDGRKLAVLSDRETDLALRSAGTPPGSDDNDDIDAERTPEEDTDAEAESKDGKGGKEDEYGEEFPQVWVFDLEVGGDPRQVTTFEEGVTEFDWEPGGERLVVAARDPTEEQAEYLERRREEDGPIETTRLQHKVDGQGFLDDVESYLFVVDVESRETRRLAETASKSGFLHGREPVWGDAGIAHVLPHPETPDDSYVTDIALTDPESGDTGRVTDSEWQYRGLTWHDDEGALLAVRSDTDNWHVPSDACTVDVDSGTVTSLTDDLDRTVAGVEPTAGGITARVADRGQTVLYAVDRKASERVFPEDRIRGVQELAASDDGQTVAGLMTDPDRREVAVFDGTALDPAAESGGPAPKQVTSFSGALREQCSYGFVRTEFDNGDGQSVEALVYTPEGFDPDDPDPTEAIVDIHGGPMAYDQPVFGFRQAYWADQGYLVVKINYRGSTSYGRSFSETIRGDWGPRETTDIKQGIERLAEREWIDPDRVFVTGFSQGGVNTAYLLTRTDVATAGAAEHGVYDFYGLYGVSDTHRWYHNDFGLPWENEAQYRKSSSLPDVDGLEDPLLITAGGTDYRCPQSQAEALYVAAKKVGVPAKLVVYPETNHEYGEPDVRIHRLEAVTEWFEQHDPAVDAGD